MAFRYRSQPAGLTADDLFYQQVMGTQFVYDETGTVVELWQLEHRLVVEAQQIQRENYLDGKPYPEPILSALFPTRTLAPGEDPCPDLTALRRLLAEADEEKRLSRGAWRRRNKWENRAAELEEAATTALASLKPSAPTAEQVDERRARRAAEAALEEEEKRAEKRAKAELAAEHQRLRDLTRARRAARKEEKRARWLEREAANKRAKARAKEDKDAAAEAAAMALAASTCAAPAVPPVLTPPARRAPQPSPPTTPTSHGSDAVMRVPRSPMDEVDAILGDDATSTKDKILAINGLPLRRPWKMAGIVAASLRETELAPARIAHACDALAYSLDDVADAVPALAAAPSDSEWIMAGIVAATFPKLTPARLARALDAMPAAYSLDGIADAVPALAAAPSDSGSDDEHDKASSGRAVKETLRTVPRRPFIAVGAVRSYAVEALGNVAEYCATLCLAAGGKRGQEADAAAPPKKKGPGRNIPSAVQERVAAGLDRLAEENGGVPVKLPQHNSTPKHLPGKKHVTKLMLDTACALMLVFFMSAFLWCQCFCSWWWFGEYKKAAWVTKLVDHIIPYGWFVRGAAQPKGQGASAGKKGDLTSYFRAFRWYCGKANRLTGGVMPEIGREAVALAFGVAPLEVPLLYQIVFIPIMLTVAFVAVLCYLPDLWVVVCCGNRCKMVSRLKKRSTAKRDVLISDDIWCSLPIYNNTWFFEIPRAVLGHDEKARLEWLHVWYLPLCCMNGRFVALYFWHDEAPEEMSNWKMVENIWCWLLGAAKAKFLPFLEWMQPSPFLSKKAARSGYATANGKECGKCSCRGGGYYGIAQAWRRLGLIDKDEHGIDRFCPPKKDLFKDSGWTDKMITEELVVPALQFFAWIALFGSLYAAGFALFKTVLKDGILRDLGPEGQVLDGGRRPLVVPGSQTSPGLRIAPDFMGHVKTGPWVTAIKASSVLHKAPDFAPAFSDEDMVAITRAKDEHRVWWFAPRIGVKCRDEVFRRIHWWSQRLDESLWTAAEVMGLDLFGGGPGDDDDDPDLPTDDFHVPDAPRDVDASKLLCSVPELTLEAPRARRRRSAPPPPPHFHLYTLDEEMLAEGWMIAAPRVGDVLQHKGDIVRVVAYLPRDADTCVVVKGEPVDVWTIQYAVKLGETDDPDTDEVEAFELDGMRECKLSVAGPAHAAIGSETAPVAQPTSSPTTSDAPPVSTASGATDGGAVASTERRRRSPRTLPAATASSTGDADVDMEDAPLPPLKNPLLETLRGWLGSQGLRRDRIDKNWKVESDDPDHLYFTDPKSGRRFCGRTGVARFLRIEEAYPGVNWELAALMVALDKQSLDPHGVDGWTVDVENHASCTKVFYIEPGFNFRFYGKPDVLKYFKALRDAPLPRETRAPHPKIVILRAYVKDKGEDPDRVNNWTWDQDRYRYVNPSSGFSYCSHAQIVKLFKAIPKRAFLEENPDRESKRSNFGEAPKDVMTDQSRHLSCLEMMGTICVICGKECGTLEELKRHREADHPDEEPVQARKEPCRLCFTLRFGQGHRRRDRRGEVCPSCEFATRGRGQYWVLEDLEFKEAYLAYLKEHGWA